MDLNIFATQITQSGKGPLSAGSSALFSNGGLGNLNFLEAILGNLNTEGEIKTDLKDKNLNPDIANDSVKKEKVDLALLQLALMGQDVDKNLDQKLAELKIEKLAQTEGNRIEQLTKLINHLTNGLPQEVTTDTSIEDLVSRLNNRLEKLTASLNAFRNNDFSEENAPFKLLIATGLNPAQFTKITDRIEEVEAKLGRQLTVEDLIAGVGNIIPAVGEKDHEFSTTDALTMLLKKTTNEDAHDVKNINKKNEEDDLQDELLSEQIVLDNSLLPFARPDIGNATHQSAGKIKNFDIQSILNIIASQKIAPAGSTNNLLESTTADDTTVMPEDGIITALPQTLSNSEFKALFGSKNIMAGDLKNNIAKLNISNITPEVAIPKVGMVGDFMLSPNWSQDFLSHQALSDAFGFDIQTGTPFTHVMQAVHLSTAGQPAGQPHPASSMVAAQITKSAQKGDIRNIILQLDPPELGRVEVRIEFGADKKVKAHMIVEKPETYLMLQRDAAALERALQNAGMDTGADSLNYKMAEENYGFGSDNNGRNSNGQGKTGTDHASQSNEDIIETTMNWNVDPDTGHVHYNIIA